MALLSSNSGLTSRHLKNLDRQSARVDQAIERLSTGKRINRPKDDPAGFVGAEQLRGEIVRMTAELKRLGGQRSLKRIEQSGLAAIRDRLIELRGLLTEASGTTITAEQRELYDKEIADSLEAVEKIEGRAKELAASRAAVNQAPKPPKRLNSSTSVSTPMNLERTAASVDQRIDAIAFSQAALAAAERYEIGVQESILIDSIAHHTEALSQIEDADFAEEAANLASGQMLSQGALVAIQLTNDLYAEQMEALLEAADVSGVSEGGA